MAKGDVVYGAPERPIRSSTGSLVPLLVITFALTAGSGAVFPLLADLQDAHHLPTYGLGLISAAAFLGAVTGLLFLAGLADRGHAKLLLLGGLALTLASLVMFALSTQLWEFVLARALGGVALGAFQPAVRAIVAARDADHVGRNLGRLAACELGGFVFGPVLGGVVSSISLTAPFWVLAVVVAAGLVTLVRTPVPAIHRAGADEARGVGASPPRFANVDLLRIRGVLVSAVLALALFLPVGVYDSMWSRYLQDRGASTPFIGITLALYGLPFVALSSRGGRLADRVGPLRAGGWALVAIAPITFMYGLFRNPTLIVSFALLEAVFQAVAVPAAQAAMATASPPGRLAAGQGLAAGMSQAGAGLAALGAAPLYQAWGPVALFGAAAGLMLALGAATWVLAQPVAAGRPGAGPIQPAVGLRSTQIH